MNTSVSRRSFVTGAAAAAGAVAASGVAVAYADAPAADEAAPRRWDAQPASVATRSLTRRHTTLWLWAVATWVL